MQKIIVETKLSPPKHQAGFIRREKLLNRLREGRKRQVISVVGPAGYGKTTLVSLWRQELIAQGHDIAWLSLNRDDSDLSQFIAYLGASIQLAAPGVGDEAITLFNRDSTDASDAFIAALVNDIQRYRRDIYLVLDDLYLVKNIAIDELIEQLLRLAPPNFHLVVISRTAPNFSLARLRAHDQITEIDFAELRLTFGEAAEFIEQQGVDIEGKEMRVVYELTDGWVSGIQLICIALKRHDDPKSHVATRLNKVTQFSEYLEAEVLSLMSGDDVNFMVKMASCRKFNAELGERLTANSRAAEIIASAEEDNLFLIPLQTDDGLQWFRYHPLMSKFLKERLSLFPAEDIKLLNRNACDWLIEHDLVAEAVRHAIYAEDFEMAANLIEKCGRQIFLEGQIKTLFSWSQLIPEDTLSHRIELQFLIAWSLLLCRRIDQASEQIDKLIIHECKMSANELVELKLLQATLFMERDDTKGMLGVVHGYEEFDGNSFVLGGMANVLSIGHCYAGEYEKARDVQLKVRRLDNNDTDLMRWLIGRCLVGVSFAFQGDMNQAERTYREALVAAEQKAGFFSDPACFAISYLAEVLYETGRWEEGRRLVLERLDIIDRLAPPDGLIRSYIPLARINYISGRVNEAKEYLEALEDLGHKNQLDRLVACALYDNLRMELHENNFTQADELLRRLNILGEKYSTDQYCAQAEIPLIAQYGRIRGLYASGKWDESLEQIQELSTKLENWRRFQEVARLKLLAAMAMAKKGEPDIAVELTEQCLMMCQRLGLVRTVLDEGDEAIALVNKVAVKTGVDSLLAAYIQQLLWNMEQTNVLDKPRESTLETLVEPLSEREMDILQLLSNSLTNKKVALALGVTPETVKWHLKNIYTKLGVGSRDEAVARGRDLNII